MSKDAKLGLVLGIALVIVIAVVFFRKDPSQAKAAAESTAAVKPRGTSLTPMVSDVRPIQSGRRHTVVAGDTLFTLAERYYNDRAKYSLIYEVNRDLLPTPSRPEPGTVLTIPD